MTAWRGAKWWAGQPAGEAHQAGRPVRSGQRKWFRWEDDLRRYAKLKSIGHWEDATGDRELWAQLEDGFVLWATNNALQSST